MTPALRLDDEGGISQPMFLSSRFDCAISITRASDPLGQASCCVGWGVGGEQHCETLDTSALRLSIAACMRVGVSFHTWFLSQSKKRALHSCAGHLKSTNAVFKHHAFLASIPSLVIHPEDIPFPILFPSRTCSPARTHPRVPRRGCTHAASLSFRARIHRCTERL